MRFRSYEGDSRVAESDNPYAPPEGGFSESAPINWKGDYTLIPRGVRCRAKVQFPPICLLTGATEDLQPVQFSRKAKTRNHSERSFAFLLEICFGFILLCFCLESFGLRPSWIPNVFFSNTLISCCVWLGLACGWLYGRTTRHRDITVKTYVSRSEVNRLMPRRILAAVLVGSIFGISRIHDGHDLLNGIGCMFVFYAAIWIFQTTVPHRQIRIAKSGADWFDLVGFSPAFLACIADDVNLTEVQIHPETTQT